MSVAGQRAGGCRTPTTTTTTMVTAKATATVIPAAVIAGARTTLAVGSKSFALAGRLLPRAVRDDAAVVYAFCRRADDAVDLAPPEQQAAAVAALRADLDTVYAAGRAAEPSLAAFQDVVRRHGIPRRWPGELIEGMAMDARGTRYATVDDLLVYCWRVAGTVGLMMARVMGVTDGAALRHAVDLGLAMQLTNICRDVTEDWQRGRLYLPRELLAGEPARAPGPPPEAMGAAQAVAALLGRAEALYASGRQGLRALPLRCAIAIAAAGSIYRAIGAELARRGHDVTRGRAVVPGWKKRLLALAAIARGLTTVPARLLARGAARAAAGAPAEEARP